MAEEMFKMGYKWSGLQWLIGSTFILGPFFDSAYLDLLSQLDFWGFLDDETTFQSHLK